MDKIQGTATGTPDDERQSHQPLASAVKTALQLYFDDLEGHSPSYIYKMVMTEVERSMFESVMEYTGKNQSHAARVLGVSRSTLRKKLQVYDLE